MSSAHPFLRNPTPLTPDQHKQLTRARHSLLSQDLCAQSRARATGQSGELYRMEGQLTLAISTLSQALTLAQKLPPGPTTTHLQRAQKLRLATALQHDHQHSRAHPLFVQLLRDFEHHDDKTYLDFAHQHFGKCLAEQGQLDRAHQHFTQALQLRLQAQPPTPASQIASTRKALAECERRMSTPATPPPLLSTKT